MSNNISIDTDGLLWHIIENLQGRAERRDPSGKNPAWTLELKLLLDELGKSLDFSSEYGHRSAGLSEFLIDFMWWDKRNKAHQQMVLAVESEWYNIRPGLPNPEILYAEEVAKDFYKLLVIKSPYKLMLFSSDGGTKRDLVVKRLESDVHSFVGHLAGEEYLLLDTSSDGWGAYRLKILTNGECGLNFSKLQIAL